MTAPTPNPFQMVDQVLALADDQDCMLHVTVTRAEPLDCYDYQGDTRYKQFLLVEDGAGKKVGVRWFGPKFDLRAGDIVQMFPRAKSDKASCRIGTDNSGKRIVKVSAMAMVLTSGAERPVVLPQGPAPAATQQPAAGGPPPNYSQPANGGQQRPAAANGGMAPVMRGRHDHVQILALQRAVFKDRWELVCELFKKDAEEHMGDAQTGELLDIATRLTATVVIAVVDGKVDLAQPSPSGGGKAASDGPPPDYLPEAGERHGNAGDQRREEDDDIPF